MQREEAESAPNQNIAKSLGQAMMSTAKKFYAQPSETARSNQTAVNTKSMWQHPFVDVFKFFKILPSSDWKQNKKEGDVSEIFAKEIGRKAMQIKGTISANNFIQIPHPDSMQRGLGLTGRYLYLQVKAPLSSTPFSFHIDLALAERSHGIRISASNLYKKSSTQNGFVMQVPLNLDVNRWTVVVFDIDTLLRHSRLLPQNYMIEGSYQIKGMTLCANSVVRGVFTSDNLYDFVTLPPDLRFKFQFQINRWPEFFAWLELPQDLDENKNENQLSEERIAQARAKAALKAKFAGEHMSQEQQKHMQVEIDTLLSHQKLQNMSQNDSIATETKSRHDFPLGSKQGFGGDDLLSAEEKLGFGISERKVDNNPIRAHQNPSAYPAGQYIGTELKRSPKLNIDPIMELKHVIGYSPSNCLNIKWSRIAQENIVLFTSAGVIIAMDAETLSQKRFFFGHSAPVSCFDVAPHGHLIASAQEGKNSIIRIWDYHTARCLSMLPMPVVTMKCLSFSPDSRYLASVGKDSHNKELIVVWDLSKIHKNEKPEIYAKQTSDFNILNLKFSPIDNSRLVSCGKENIRFWRIKETGNIRGSAVVLNQHARNTVFTCLDFESGAHAAATGTATNPEMRENEALKRVYVGSKSGMVFQVNYLTETLEATYKTNDASIYSIAVNEAFCVTGSEDMFLRVWPLDFSEFIMEAKHEGTVCSVDISADGLRVVCGTLNGSLAVLDKSNQRYRTLMRAHTDRILSMDFHPALHQIISASSDGTIRLWDIKTFEQQIEFNSPLETPLCVAAHPTLPIFACGFQTGTLRLFDCEKLCVAAEFTQFNKPIRAMAYSPAGNILVTCCEDGSFVIHNARRQHMPTKMMHLEFMPQFVHVAFSPEMMRVKRTNQGFAEIQSSEQSAVEMSSNQNTYRSEIMEGPQGYFESMFAVVGENGNNVMVYSSESAVLRHHIQVGTVVKSFQFSKNGKELIVVTKDMRIRFYSLVSFEGIYSKELTTVHRGAIRSTDLSQNGGFMLTAGEDNLIKLWDYDAQTTSPTFYQAFIGHTFPVLSTMFNPLDNGMIFSAGDKDGLLIWEFHGDTTTNFFPQTDDEEQPHTFPMTIEVDTLHQPSVLEQMRAKVQERRKPKLAEFSFMLPEFTKLQRDNLRDNLPKDLPFEYVQDAFERTYQERMKNEQLTSNHYISMQDQYEFKVQISDKQSNYLGEDECMVLPPFIVNGYDGFSGVHDNLIWNALSGCMIYTLHNKVIIEQTKTREQTVLPVSTVRLSCLAQSANGKYLAAAEGEPNEQGQGFIYLIDLSLKQVKKTLVFHQKGIQTLAFGFQDKLIVSVGVKDTHCLVLHSVEYGNAIKPTNCRTHATNKIVIQESKDDVLTWVTIGTKGSLILWQIQFDSDVNVDREIKDDFPNTEVRYMVIEMPTEELQFTDFLTAAFRENKMVIGCSDGSVVAFDISKGQDGFIDGGKKVKLCKSQITQVSVRPHSVVVANSGGSLVSYPSAGSLLPPEDRDKITLTEMKAGGITAIAMDDKNEEGMVATDKGKIFYVSLKETKESKKIQVPLVQKVSTSLDEVSKVRIDPANPKVFTTNCGFDRGEVKLISSATLDTVYTFKDSNLGPVRFITSNRNKKSNEIRMVGYAQGVIRFVSLFELQDRDFYQVQLEEGEELTCGCFTSNGHNWALGTSFGAIILGAPHKDLFRKHQGYLTTRIDGLMQSQDFGVTSIQLSNFEPQGTILASFENGEVKLWKSAIPEERLRKIRDQMDEERRSRKKNRSAKVYDLAEIGIQKFDIHDIFDMFENPHSLAHEGNEDLKLKELYGGKRYSDTQAFFDPTGSHGNEIYFSCVSALQYIFIRNFELHQVLKRIPLMHFPTTLEVIDCAKFPAETPFKDTMVCVGTKEGRVLLYNIEAIENCSCVARTQAGVMFGEVRSLSVQPDGSQLVAASSTGEVASFNIHAAFGEK